MLHCYCFRLCQNAVSRYSVVSIDKIYLKKNLFLTTGMAIDQFLFHISLFIKVLILRHSGFFPISRCRNLCS